MARIGMSATKLNPKYGLGVRAQRVMKFLEDEYAISNDNGDWLDRCAEDAYEDILFIYLLVEGLIDPATGRAYRPGERRTA